MNFTTSSSTNEPERRVLAALHSFTKCCILYTFDHPSTAQACAHLLTQLHEILQERVEFSIEQVNGLFVCGNVALIEDSLIYYELLRRMEDLNISRVTFVPGVDQEELMRLGAFLIGPHANKPEGNEAGASKSWAHIQLTVQDESMIMISMAHARRARIERVQETTDGWETLTTEVFSKLVDEQSFPLSQLSTPMDILIDELDRDPAIFATQMARFSSPSLHVQHAIQTMVLSLYLGKKIGLDMGPLKLLGLAALLHDVGRLFLPTEFSTGYRMKPEDVELVHVHCQDGASFLAGVAGLPSLLIRAALEHHMSYDGGGYPRLSSTHKPHALSQIIGLADFVSWGTVSDRYYHRPVPLHRLVRSVVRRSGTQFDPILVKLVLPFFGWYPPGTKVRLNTGEEALSLEPNFRNFLRPGVVPTAGSEPNRPWFWLASLQESSSTPFLRSVERIIQSDSLGSDFLKSVPDINPERQKLKPR